jgi:hypothetical protein
MRVRGDGIMNDIELGSNYEFISPDNFNVNNVIINASKQGVSNGS